MLVGPDGQPLQKSEEQIQEILNDLAPKNATQRAILARLIGERIEKARKAKMNKGLKEGFGDTFKRNTKIRKEGSKSESGDWQLIAAIPKEMAYVAEQVWGPEVFTNKELFNEAFVKDEMGKYCLTVDPKTI